MMGLEFTGQVPFNTVYLHGLIRDEHGRKMSKTYQNVIDPLLVMDEFGTDALRFTLLVGSTPGNDSNVGLKKVESNRNFANKIWNAGRFVIHSLSSLPPVPSGVKTEIVDFGIDHWTLADQWIWARLEQLIREVDRLFQSFQYGEAGRQIYEFFWSDFADWYVEISKLQLKNETQKNSTTLNLIRIMDLSLRLLHPFTPFVTEELWGYLRLAVLDSSLAEFASGWPEALIVAPWPQPREPEGWEDSKTADFYLIQEIVRSVRNLRAERDVQPSNRIAATIIAGEKSNLLREQSRVIAALAGLDPEQFKIQEHIKGIMVESASLVVGSVEVYFPMAGILDAGLERSRLEKELIEATAQIDRLEKLLTSDFSMKAPPSVVQKERDKLSGFKETAAKLSAQIKLIK